MTVSICKLGIHHCEAEFAGGNDFAIHKAATIGLADASAHFDHFGFDEERVSGEDWLAELYFVGGHEVADFSLVVGESHDENGGRLGHRFELQDTGHDGVSGEVSLEEGFVERDVLDRGAFRILGEVDDAVDEEEGVAVGEDFQDVLDVEDGLSFRELDFGNEGGHAGILLLDHGGHLCVGPVTWGDGDDVAGDAFSAEEEIANEVECLVSGKLVGVAHGFLGEDLFAADDDRVFERAAFDESFVEEGFDVLVECEGSGGSDFLFVGLCIDLTGEILREASVWSEVGDGDAESAGGDDGDVGALAVVEVDRFTDFPGFTGLVLRFEASLFDEFDVWFGGAVSDGRLVGIHLDEGIVDAHAGEGGDDVFDGVDADGADGEGGGSLDCFDPVDVGVDEGFVGKVDTAEFESVAAGGGTDGEGDLFAGVEGGPLQRGGGGEGVFHVARHAGIVNFERGGVNT